MSRSVALAPEVIETVRSLRDRGEVPLRCHTGPIRTSVAAAVTALCEDVLGSRVRPWDLSALRRSAAGLGAVTGATVLFVDDPVLVAELHPGGQRIALRGVEDGWRLVRFLDPAERPADVVLAPETIREIELDALSAEGVLIALGIAKPDDVELDVDTEDLGQGQTETRYRYLFTDNGRSVLAEEVMSEIFDGATPRSSRVRGVVIDRGHGVLLTANRERAWVIQG